MGGNIWRPIWHTLLPKLRARLIIVMIATAILLADYISMARMIDGGGLGDLAIRFGYQRFQTDAMMATVPILTALA